MLVGESALEDYNCLLSVRIGYACRALASARTVRSGFKVPQGLHESLGKPQLNFGARPCEGPRPRCAQSEASGDFLEKS